MMWTFFVVNYQLYNDLVSYHEDWDDVWIREFYKSTKNFFLFIMILLFLTIVIGLAAVGTENRSLLGVFIAILITEWIFEFIGVYESKDRNVLMYRMIPSTLRPGIFVITYIFMQKLKRQENISYNEENNENPNHARIQNMNGNGIQNGHHRPNGRAHQQVASVSGSQVVNHPLSLNSSVRNGINNNNIFRQNHNHHVSSIQINQDQSQDLTDPHVASIQVTGYKKAGE